MATTLKYEDRRNGIVQGAHVGYDHKRSKDGINLTKKIPGL